MKASSAIVQPTKARSAIIQPTKARLEKLTTIV